MRSLIFLCLVAGAALSAFGAEAGYPITPVPFTDVRFTDEFWARRLEVNRMVTIPYAFRQCDETGRLKNFDVAGDINAGRADSGKFCSRYGFDDSDVFKIIEGASYTLQAHPDASLSRYLDVLISRIARAQEPDGYLYSMRTIDPGKSWAKERWVNDRAKSSHELYNAGHLYEAAVAHFYATGKRQLLNIAVRNANLLCATFGPGRMRTVPGHQGIELALARLSLATGNHAYLELAKFFLDERGNPPGSSEMQDHLPVVRQAEAVGHAVRAGYMYSGMADIAALTGDHSYITAIDRIWEDVVSHKLYVTGGTGAVGSIEGFGAPYDLPNLDAYCETCASIANIFWNQRMFLRHGESRYIDVLERTLYNAFLSGVALEGNRFFYPNPLESTKGTTRSPWFACACCPSNIVRFLPSLPGYVYATRNDSLYVNLFIPGEASVRLPGGVVRLVQQGGYPWTGNVSITVHPRQDSPFLLLVRIPGWSLGVPAPGGLYKYAESKQAGAILKVNGRPVNYRVQNGYAVVARRWKDGDRLELELPMAVRRIVADDRVEADLGRIALERGPLVYCLEGVDASEGRVLDLVIPDTARLGSFFHPGILGGVQVIEGNAFSARRALDGSVEAAGARPFTAIPYYAWAHRGTWPMTVWPAREIAAARPVPASTIAFNAKISSSGGRGQDALTDQLMPRHSNDHSIPAFHWHPAGKPTTEWIQYDFARPASVSRISVYWADDQENVRVPSSWQVLVRSEGAWVPLAGVAAYGTERDKSNDLHFPSVEIDGIRLEVRPHEGKGMGLYEVSVH